MKNVDWIKWSSIAEILGAVAILITLLYLAIQTDQQTAAILSSGQQAALQVELDWLYKTIDDPKMYFGRLPEFDDNVDSDTKVKRIVAANALFRIRENNWLQYQGGAIDQGTWDGYLVAFTGYISVEPYARWAWENQNFLEPGFVRAVNERLNQASGTQP